MDNLEVQLTSSPTMKEIRRQENAQWKAIEELRLCITEQQKATAVLSNELKHITEDMRETAKNLKDVADSVPRSVNNVNNRINNLEREMNNRVLYWYRVVIGTVITATGAVIIALITSLVNSPK